MADWHEPGAGSSAPADVGTTYQRTPMQVFNFAKLIGYTLPAAPLLLCFVLVILFVDGPEVSMGLALDPVSAVLVALGTVAAVASPAIQDVWGRATANAWAISLVTGAPASVSQPSTKVFGLDVGPTHQERPTLEARLSTVSIAGCAIPEIAPLMTFVVSVMSNSITYMVFGMVLYFVFWWRNLPRRERWDEWAGSAGLHIQWASQADSGPSIPV